MDGRGLAEISEVKLLRLSRGFSRKLSFVASPLRHNGCSHHLLITFSKQSGWVGGWVGELGGVVGNLICNLNIGN